MKSQPSRNIIVFVQPRRRAPQECGSNQVLLGREQNCSPVRVLDKENDEVWRSRWLEQVVHVFSKLIGSDCSYWLQSCKS